MLALDGELVPDGLGGSHIHARASVHHVGGGAGGEGGGSRPPQAEYEGGGPKEAGVPPRKGTMGVTALAALLFFNVSGGPFGTEGMVKAAGPFYSILGILIMPALWCFPVGLMTAELSTAFPKDGGYVLWVHAAFGSFWSFQMGWWSWACGVVDNALYPVMFVSIAEKTLGFRFDDDTRVVVSVAFSTVLTGLNILGTEAVGAATIVCGVMVLLPVTLLVLECIPHLDPTAWGDTLPHTDLVSWVNLALWNLNGWDAVSTIGSEVINPSHTYPRAILLAGMLVVTPYLATIMASTGVDQRYYAYTNGHYNRISVKRGGMVLGTLFAGGAAAAVCGNFIADMTLTSYQMMGMAEEHMLPSFLAWKLPRLNTPIFPILLGYVCVIIASTMIPFGEILACDNLLYSCQLLLEIAALITLRRRQPDLPRPYRIPCGVWGLAALMLAPSTFCFYVFFTSSYRVIMIALCVMLVGLAVFAIRSQLRRQDNGYASRPHSPLHALASIVPSLHEYTQRQDGVGGGLSGRKEP